MKSGGHDMVDDGTCVVCCRNSVRIFAVGECDHPVCYECATRMRVLANQNECAICRTPLPKVFLVRERKTYATVADSTYPLFNTKYQIYFKDEDVQESCYRLLEHRCRMCRTRPTYATFGQLKDHMCREHELFYCDLCVENLTVFTHERKCYNRADLARHRRIGDADDTSHRGHPLCEFCDERYVDNDELFRHLRRDHFYCHFCDADGLHHYYSDYGYLREHFRVEHFLCDDEACEEERFTTAFRSEIDLKAHRAAVHNRNMTKAQAKQARTLELEFTITPRAPGGSMASMSGTSTAYTSVANGETYMEDGDSATHHRRGRRGEYGSQTDGGTRKGSSHPHFPSRSNPARRDPLNVTATNQQDSSTSHPVAVSTVDLNPDQFPVLGDKSIAVATASNGTAHDEPGSARNQTVDTLARKLAKLNRFTVGTSDGLGDTEFPALCPSDGPSSSRSFSAHPSKSWTAPGNLRLKSSANLQVKSSSNHGTPTTGSTKKTLKVKLNSKEDFPGLASKTTGKPRVSLQVSQTVIPPGQNIRSTKSQNELEQQQRQPVLTRVTSSQNIRFLGSSAKEIKGKPNGNKEPLKKESLRKSDEESDSKKGDYRVESELMTSQKRSNIKAKMMDDDDFPALETKKPNMSIATVDARSKGREKKPKSSLEFAASQLPTKKTQQSDPGEKSAKNGVKIDQGVSIADKDENELPKYNVAVTSTDSGFDGTSVENFPDLRTRHSKIRKASTPPPPGFGKLKTVHQTGPPPGFRPTASSVAAAWTPPPPGFTPVIPSSEPSSAMTFTNSNGQNYTFSTMALGKSHEYVQPDGFQARNHKLMEGLADILKDKDSLATFRLLSGLYRKGEITAADYYRECSDVLGTDEFAKVFSELIVLLPDIQKQQMLLTVHKASRKHDNNKNLTTNKQELTTSVAPKILVCATCQQVLSVKDFRTHMDHHSLEQDFPSLLGSDLSSVLQSKKATWVERN